MIDEWKLIGELDAWWETLDPRTNARDSIICDAIEAVIEKINNADSRLSGCLFDASLTG